VTVNVSLDFSVDYPAEPDSYSVEAEVEDSQFGVVSQGIVELSTDEDENSTDSENQPGSDEETEEIEENGNETSDEEDSSEQAYGEGEENDEPGTQPDETEGPPSESPAEEKGEQSGPPAGERGNSGQALQNMPEPVQNLVQAVAGLF